MPERELLVRIIGDDRDLQRALRNTDRNIERIDSRTATFGRNIGRAFAAAGVAIGAREVLEGAGAAVDAASNLNEQIAKSREVFGAASGDIETWAQSTASSFGIAEAAALTATGTFGNLFAVVDIAPEQAANLSRALVELAADLASFNNANPEEVLTAIRSGLIGEAEPLRRYGVLLSEARVQQVALATSGKLTAASLTDQEKALARYEIILQDTTKAQGDFNRTQESLANQSRILRANLSDLEADIGSALVPAFEHLARSANDLFDVFGRGQDDLEIQVDTANAEKQIRDIRDELADWGPVINSRTQELREMLRLLEQFQAVSSIAPNEGAGPRGPGAIRLSNAEVERKALKEAQRELAKARREFDEFLKGQGLKLDAASLTQDLGDDLAVLRAIESAILRRISAEGRTFKLVEQLTRVRQQIARTVEQQADDARRAGEDAFNATIDALELDLEMAQATKSLADDQEALRAIEQAILRRISTEGQTTDLMRQLFQVREEQRRVAEQLAEQRRERRQGRQFEALGLTEEGERPTPGVGALSRRLQNLRDQIKGTVLDTEKTRRELDRIAEVLSGKFGAVGKEVREAILAMLNDISGALEGEGSRKGPLTKTSGLNTKKILAGLGLSPEEINALRGRLSSINSAGNQLAGGPPAPRIRAAGSDSSPSVNVENVVYVSIDGKRLTATVTKEQQRTKRRNPKQKRGPNRNI